MNLNSIGVYCYSREYAFIYISRIIYESKYDLYIRLYLYYFKKDTRVYFERT